MDFVQWISTLDSSVISILGFIVTIIVIDLQFRNAKKEKITDEQRRLYAKCYMVIKKVLSNKELVFSRDYLEDLKSFCYELDLMASYSVLSHYKKYLCYVEENVHRFEMFYDNLKRSVEYQTDDEGNQIIISDEEQQFELERQIDYFMKRECPKDTKLLGYVRYIINAMRFDLENEMIFTYDFLYYEKEKK